MKKIIILALIVLMAACGNAEVERTLFDLKNTQLGDASNVGAVLGHLDGGTFQLQTAESPYGLTVAYEELTEAQAFDNAVVIFTLIPNAGWVSFEMGEEEIRWTRDEVTEILGRELDFESEEEMRSYLGRLPAVWESASS